MDLDKITAENMRKLLPNNTELEDVLTSILAENDKGECRLYLSLTTLKQSTIIELKSRGLTIETGGRFNENNTIIYW